MSYAYELEDGTVATANNLRGVQNNSYVEFLQVPDAPRESWRIVNGLLSFDAEIATSIANNSAVTADKAKNLIDKAAGNARARFIAEGWEVVEEYRLAQQEVAAWRDVGSPAGDVPLSISTWATAQGMTDEDAAQGIEAAATNFESLLLSIRAIRLAGKGALDQATENFDSVAQPYIDQLDAITP